MAGPGPNTLLRLGDAYQAGQLGIAEVPGALDAASIAQPSAKARRVRRTTHLIWLWQGESTWIVATTVIGEHAGGDALLTAVFRPRGRRLTIAFQQALDLFLGAPRRHAAHIQHAGEGYLKGGTRLDAYSNISRSEVI
jgi:hypothetical protein